MTLDGIARQATQQLTCAFARDWMMPMRQHIHKRLEHERSQVKLRMWRHKPWPAAGLRSRGHEFARLLSGLVT